MTHFSYYCCYSVIMTIITINHYNFIITTIIITITIIIIIINHDNHHYHHKYLSLSSSLFPDKLFNYYWFSSYLLYPTLPTLSRLPFLSRIFVAASEDKHEKVELPADFRLETENGKRNPRFLFFFSFYQRFPMINFNFLCTSMRNK